MDKLKEGIKKEYIKLFGPDMNKWPFPLCSSAKRIYEQVKARVQKRLEGKDNKRPTR